MRGRFSASFPVGASNPATETGYVQQQTRNLVTGKVVDAAGMPIIGVNVIEKGNGSNGTITNIDGEFSVRVTREPRWSFLISVIKPKR